MLSSHVRVRISIGRTLRDIRRDGLKAVRRKLRRVPGVVSGSRLVESLRLTFDLFALWRVIVGTGSRKSRGLARERIDLVRRRLEVQRASPDRKLERDVLSSIGSGRLDEARRLLDSADPAVKSSAAGLHLSAQVSYLRGDWRASIADRVEETRRMDDRAAGSWLAKIGVRFVSGEFIGHIGHLGLIDLIQRARHLDILSPEPRVFVGRKDAVANLAYLECWRPHMDVQYLELDEYRIFEELMRPLFEDVSVLRMRDSRPDFYRAYAAVNVRWREEGRSELIAPDPEMIERARAVFESHGLGPNQWFVGLHVREGDPYPWTNAVDSDVSTYLPAIRSIVAAGGAVIRIGSPHMWRLPEMRSVIDYAVADWKDPELDVFVWSQCRFFVGTGSGPLNIPPTFGRPSLISNFPSSALDQGFLDHMMLPKRIVGTDGSGIPFDDVLSSPFGYGISRSHEGFDWRIEDNTPEELEEACREMIDLTNAVGGFERVASAQSGMLDEFHALGRTGRTPFPASFVHRHPTLFGR